MAGLKSNPASTAPANAAARTAGTNGEYYLGRLAELGLELARSAAGSEPFFASPLNIVQEAMGFTISVVYRVEHVIDRTLILEVAGALDPAGQRPSLVRGARVAINLDQPDSIFRNEAQAFLHRGVAAVNVPGVGCDIAGYVSAGETEADAYLLAGDFVGAEAGLQPTDRRVFEIATGLLSALLTKAHFQHRADHDRLTGLMSSARIRTELEHALRRGPRESGHALIVVLADADHFKRINDEHGHLAGDAVLAELGQLVAGSLRAGQDQAGRFGGEEFLILLEHAALEEAARRLEQLRLNVAEHAFRGLSEEPAALPVTLSIGAAVCDPAGPPLSATEALALADRALYAAKRGGRNRIVTLHSRASLDTVGGTPPA